MRDLADIRSSHISRGCRLQTCGKDRGHLMGPNPIILQRDVRIVDRNTPLRNDWQQGQRLTNEMGFPDG